MTVVTNMHKTETYDMSWL